MASRHDRQHAGRGSGYATNVTTGRWKPNANHALVAWTQKRLAEVEAVRSVHWEHVKGHSADGGNDPADALVTGHTPV